jgi:hypothetical protein
MFDEPRKFRRINVQRRTKDEVWQKETFHICQKEGKEEKGEA